MNSSCLIHDLFITCIKPTYIVHEFNYEILVKIHTNREEELTLLAPERALSAQILLIL